MNGQSGVMTPAGGIFTGKFQQMFTLVDIIQLFQFQGITLEHFFRAAIIFSERTISTYCNVSRGRSGYKKLGIYFYSRDVGDLGVGVPDAMVLLHS